MKKIIEMRTYLILILLSVCLSIYSFDCKSFEGDLGEKRRVNYEISDVVLLGVMTNIEDHIGIIKVSEVFKGCADSSSIIKFENIIPKQYVFCLWLIYGNKIKGNDTIYVNQCSFSRNTTGFMLTPPPPPPMFYNKNKKNNEILSSLEEYKLFVENYLLFFEEIEVLRIIRKK